MNKYFWRAMGAALVLSALAFGRVAAAADLIKCDPPVGATLATAPAQVRCTFSEALETTQSKMQVLDSEGKRVDKNDARVDLSNPARTQIVISLDPSQMRDGTYTVDWRAVAGADNAVANGAFLFFVGGDAVSSTQPQIRIVSPVNNQIVPLGNLKVQITTENSSASNYWQLYVDDQMVGTPENGATSLTPTITASGPHTLKATLADAKSASLASATIVVTAALETPSQSPFNVPWVAPVMAVFVVVVLGLLFVALRIARPTVEEGQPPAERC